MAENISSADNSNIYPLYLYSKNNLSGEMEINKTNLKMSFLKKLSDMLRLEIKIPEKGNLKNTIGPDDVFSYIYSVLFSPTAAQVVPTHIRKTFIETAVQSALLNDKTLGVYSMNDLNYLLKKELNIDLQAPKGIQKQMDTTLSQDQIELLLGRIKANRPGFLEYLDNLFPNRSGKKSFNFKDSKQWKWITGKPGAGRINQPKIK